MFRRRTLSGVLALAAAVVAVTAPSAEANQWNDRTIIELSDPVMVPDATLQPGTYVFKLLDSPANRQVVQILNEDESQVIATTVAIPARRMDPKGDVVLKLNPTDGGPPAIKSWFYPGTLYGHQFVYPDSQAKEIASRTRTLVLSRDVNDSDMNGGTIYVYNPQGRRHTYARDTATEQAWADWHRQQTASAAGNPGTTGDEPTGATARTITPPEGSGKSAAPMVLAQAAGTRVDLGDLEENATKYAGQTVSVTGEVEKVLGPRLFTIDEPNWIDLDGEVLVHMSTDLAALVTEGDRVTVTGRPTRWVKAELEKEWGWLPTDGDVEIELSKKPVLLASRVVGGNDNVAMMISTGSPTAAPRSAARAGDTGSPAAVGTSGTTTTVTSSQPAITDLPAIARGDDALVGRKVTLTGVTLGQAAGHGYWLGNGSGPSVYVLPAGDSQPAASADARTASLDGVILRMPRSMRDEVDPGRDWNDDIYVYATNLSQ